MKQQNPDIGFALNGLSIHNLSLAQDGTLDVEFDLPEEQTTAKYYTYRRGSRSFDVYDDQELEEACRRLFQVLRARVMEDDEETAAVHCDRCRTSACCRKYNVLLRDSDIERLASHLKMPVPTFRKRYTRPAVDWCGDFARQLACDDDPEGEEKCVFLGQDAEGRWRCTVYEHRPQICRDFDMKACDDFVSIDELETA